MSKSIRRPADVDSQEAPMLAPQAPPLARTPYSIAQFLLDRYVATNAASVECRDEIAMHILGGANRAFASALQAMVGHGREPDWQDSVNGLSRREFGHDELEIVLQSHQASRVADRLINLGVAFSFEPKQKQWVLLINAEVSDAGTSLVMEIVDQMDASDALLRYTVNYAQYLQSGIEGTADEAAMRAPEEEGITPAQAHSTRLMVAGLLAASFCNMIAPYRYLQCHYCGMIHPPCKMCGAACCCSEEEPVPFVYCKSCDSDMAGDQA